jgi:phage-related baseplate assembly protein
MRLAAAFACVALSLPLPATVFAQAGSTGGAIGKTISSNKGITDRATISPDGSYLCVSSGNGFNFLAKRK